MNKDENRRDVNRLTLPPCHWTLSAWNEKLHRKRGYTNYYLYHNDETIVMCREGVGRVQVRFLDKERNLGFSFVVCVLIVSALIQSAGRNQDMRSSVLPGKFGLQF